jgi:thiamine biosynthesis protein ThiI
MRDCCTLFTPRHPATRARLEEVVEAEKSLDITALVDAAIAGVVVEEFRWPVLT